MAAGEKQRDFLFDNYKAMLIVLVVVGHFIELAPDENVILRMLKWAIFSFHMPAFVFISGYFFEKRDERMGIDPQAGCPVPRI